MHFVIAVDVDGVVTPEELRRQIADRVPYAPELRRMLRYALGGRGRPVWIDDPKFDISRHISADLEQGTRDEVHAALLQRNMSRDRPLWRMNLRADGTASTVYLSIHHAMMDGGLLAHFLAAVFPAEGSTAPPAPTWRQSRPPSQVELLALLVAGRLSRLTRRVRRSGHVVRSAATAEPRLLGGAIAERRVVGSAELALSAVRTRARSAGVTVNDYFLFAVTESLREGLPQLGLSPLPTSVIGLMPRSIRDVDEARAIGNRTRRRAVPLPVGEPRPGHRLQAIRAATEAAKAADPGISDPGPFDISVSNVRYGGPHAIAGHPVLREHSCAPLRDTRVLAVATSYLDRLVVTYTADADLISDPGLLADLTVAALNRDLPI
ncbi:MAG: diacylglycerol O-acyltransferase / wax synthase [Actinomycetota bacterium]|jgi:hypothetical protein|nr:diacylglycerol O-acyltransferase / wax synthase [Actinomycetota bacterium]